MNGKAKVVVAMSGGVDSSVAACLLCEQGYEVVGLFMRTGTHGAPAEASAGFDRHRGCCSATDAADARFVAGMLGAPFYALNFEREFDGLIEDFADQYAQGRTPNPCVTCNYKLKFGRLVEYADAVGAEFIATGHYARVEAVDGQRRLRRAVDLRKDQSYVLFAIDRALLDRAIFPIGGMEKNEVRDVARRRGLPNCDKPDSVEICFVPDRDYVRVVRERRPDAFREGDVVDAEGNVLGRHAGTAHFTIGQRRGLRIAAGVPIYVTALDAPGNRVTMGTRDQLLRAGLIGERSNFLVSEPPECFRGWAKIRYLHEAAPATIERLESGLVRVMFDQPQPAITPGQAVVFYDEAGYVWGGAWIREGFDTGPYGSTGPIKSSSLSSRGAAS